MNEPVRKLTFTEEDTHDAELMLGREWLVTNGLGGFASGTLAGMPTRRYHGLLVSALPTPLGRTVMFNHLSEWVRLPSGARQQIGGQERTGGHLDWPGAKHLREFRLEAGLPVWRYELDGAVVEKRILLVHSQNTVHISYRLVEGEGPLRLKLRPALQFRPLEEAVHSVRERALHRHLDRRPSGSLDRPQVPAAASQNLRPARDLLARRRQASGRAIQDGGAPRLRPHGRALEPRLLQRRRDEGGERHARRLDRKLGADSRALARGGRRGGARAARAPARVGRALGAPRASPPSLSSPQTSSSSRPRARQEDAARAHAAGEEVRIGHRRLPLVHGLGPRHDDQPRRA